MSKQVLLKEVRLSYAHLETPAKYIQGEGFVEDSENGNYSAVLLIEKGSEAEKKLLAAVAEVRSEALTSGIKDSNKKTVKVTQKDMLRYNDGIKDGDTKDDENYQDHIYVNAKAGAKYKPTVYDEKNSKVENTTLYSGCYVNVYLNIYNYMAASNLGSSYGLVALQFSHDGEPLSGLAVDRDSIFGDRVETPKSTANLFE